MRFGYSQGDIEIKIDFNDSDLALNELIQDGFLEETIFDIVDCDDDRYIDIVSDAVIDKIKDMCERKDEKGTDDEFLKETNDVIRAMYVIDENLFFSQFLEWNWA